MSRFLALGTTYAPVSVRSRPQTIQIFLPDGDPRGVRLAEITSRTVQAVQVPRGVFERAAARAELQQVGVYFLVGEGEEVVRPRLYVGEAENCLSRLGQHHRGKEFWTQAVAVTSKTQRFDKGQARWLEWLCTREAKAAGRYAVENLAAAAEPHLTEPVKADLYDHFDTLRTLVATLGFPLFEPLVAYARAAAAAPTPVVAASAAVAAEPAAVLDTPEVWTCRGRGAEARSVYGPDGLVVLAGSTAAATHVASAERWRLVGLRDRLREQGVLVPDGEVLRFGADHLFASPSAAAVAVLGRNANGWVEWKDAEGRTLDEVKRQPQAP